MNESPVFEINPARINERFIAYLLDLIPFLAGYALSLSYFRVHPHPPNAGWRITEMVLIAYFFYESIGNMAGATIGKWIMGIRVIGTDGRSLGFFRGIMRAAGYFVSTPFFNFGFIIALFHPQSRALHDMMAGTVVVESRPKNSSQAAATFALAVVLIAGICGASLYLSSKRLSPEDEIAVAKAQKALAVLGRIEEAYKSRHGAYTASLQDLANASGDVDAFKVSLADIFRPDDFILEADQTRYRIQAQVNDSGRQPVSIVGPRAR
ncbi:MAG: RDD family protein [Elusimicrobiota bacterium]